MLHNKKILVLGAGGLLGSQTVKELLKNSFFVIAADIDSNLIKQKLETVDVDLTTPGLSIIQFDITNSSQVIDFFSDANELDGVVNCTYPRNTNYGCHFFDVTLKDFNENLALHLGSSFLLMQQCAAFFLRKETPFSLVNIASVYGVIPPHFDIYADTSMTMPVEYAAIKSAIIHMNKYVAKYVNNSNFRVNSVSPGGIFDNQPQAFINKYKKYTLGKGLLNASDITRVILFLLSSQSNYINGQNLIVDDGFSL